MRCQEQGASPDGDRAAAATQSSPQAVLSKADIPSAIVDAMMKCPDYADFPTAWAIQHSHGANLAHHPRCSSVPGWDPVSGPGLLCDCDAIQDEWKRLRDMLGAAPMVSNAQIDEMTANGWDWHSAYLRLQTTAHAKAMEARQGRDGEAGSVHDSAVPEGNLP